MTSYLPHSFQSSSSSSSKQTSDSRLSTSSSTSSSTGFQSFFRWFKKNESKEDRQSSRQTKKNKQKTENATVRPNVDDDTCRNTERSNASVGHLAEAGPSFRGPTVTGTDRVRHAVASSSSSSCDSVFSTATNGFAFINPDHYNPHGPGEVVSIALIIQC